VLTLVAHDELGGSLTTAIADAPALAQRMHAFCPDIVDQGHETVEALAEWLAKSRRLYFWWD
jgi:hypothetical protein